MSLINSFILVNHGQALSSVISSSTNFCLSLNFFCVLFINFFINFDNNSSIKHIFYTQIICDQGTNHLAHAHESGK